MKIQKGKHNKFFIIPTICVYNSASKKGKKVLAFIVFGYYLSIGADS